MVEKRTCGRRPSLFYLGVFDLGTGNLVGKLVNMSRSGIMLVAEVPVRVGKSYNLRVAFPIPVSGHRGLRIPARSVWCRQGLLPRFYSAGFEFLALPDPERRLLEEVERQYLLTHPWSSGRV